MPFLEQPPYRALPSQGPSQPPRASFLDMIDALFGRKSLGETVDRQAGASFDPSINDAPKGYEGFADRFAGAASPAEMAIVRKQIDEERLGPLNERLKSLVDKLWESP